MAHRAPPMAWKTLPMAEPETLDEATQRSRKRFARRQWRRRWLAWKYLLAPVVVVVLIVVAVWAVFFSSWLSVRSVDVRGLSDQTGPAGVTSAQVRRAADVPLGGPLLRADLASVRTRVLALAGVKGADVSREWPDKILIEVTQRVPVAVVEIGGRLHALDADGVVFANYAHAPRGMPKVETPEGTSAQALSQAAEVAGALPAAIARKVDHVQVATVDEISLAFRDGRTVAWGSAADSDAKAKVLAALLKAAPHASKYDVSVPGQPVTS